MMKNFKNYMYCNNESKMYARVYHDKNKKQAVFTDSRFMIISKELFDSSKDVEYLKKIKNDEFDYHAFNYDKVIYPKEDLEEINSNLFMTEIYLANESMYDTETPYKDALLNKSYFEDFGFCLSTPIIHVINEFLTDNKGREFKVFVNKEDITKNIMIEVYNDDFLNDGIINTMLFMPIATNNEYQIIIKNNELEHKSGTYQKNIEKLYSWSDMANELTSRGIPHEVVRNLADVFTAMIMNRPIFNIIKFDDYLHERFGDYESKNKSMRDMFIELFGNDANKMAYYFGIDVKEEE